MVCCMWTKHRRERTSHIQLTSKSMDKQKATQQSPRKYTPQDKPKKKTKNGQYIQII